MAVNLGSRVVPSLLVADMRRTLEFYVEKLGFTQTGFYPIESDPEWTEVRRDGVAIHFYVDAPHATRYYAELQRHAVLLSGQRRGAGRGVAREGAVRVGARGDGLRDAGVRPAGPERLLSRVHGARQGRGDAERAAGIGGGQR